MMPRPPSVPSAPPYHPTRRAWLRGLAGSLGSAAGFAPAVFDVDSAWAAEGSAAAAADDKPEILALQPLGEQLPDEQVALVRQALGAFYDYEVQLLPRVALPKAAYYAPRKRYRAEKILDELVNDRPDAARFVLGLTAVDISTTKGKVFDWGVLGLANIAGTACVISTFRTTRGASSALHAQQRFAKTAVHEIGHNLGLPHCPNRGCLMEDGQGSVFTTDHEFDLCADCRAKLAKSGAKLTTGGSIPWPEPGSR
jgi:archaemetzincin